MGTWFHRANGDSCLSGVAKNVLGLFGDVLGAAPDQPLEYSERRRMASWLRTSISNDTETTLPKATSTTSQTFWRRAAASAFLKSRRVRSH